MADITGLLLAAGASRRFGANKLLVEINGLPLIAHSAAALAPCDRLIAVVRAEDEAVQSCLQGLGIEWVSNPEAGRGMGYSIACAVKASADSHGWCLLPADMPYVTATTTGQVVAAMNNGATLAAAFYHDQRGHPVGFSASFYPALTALDGDSGARVILQQHLDQLVAIKTNDAGVLHDIDTPADLQSPRFENK